MMRRGQDRGVRGSRSILSERTTTFGEFAESLAVEYALLSANVEIAQGVIRLLTDRLRQANRKLAEEAAYATSWFPVEV
jgi:hypothetical protein